MAVRGDRVIVLLQNSKMPPPFILKLPLLFGLFWSSGKLLYNCNAMFFTRQGLQQPLAKGHAILTPKWTSQERVGLGLGEGVTGALKGGTSAYGL